MRDKIKEYCEREKLVFGVTDAKPFWDIYEYLKNKNEDLGGFVCNDIEKRIDPKKMLPEAESIIVIGKCYNKKIAFEMDDKKRCKLALGAFGEDYHIYLRKHLEEIADIIKEKNPDAKVLCFSDTGPLDDREAARRAGLGAYGKNHLLITEKFGSAVNLGYIITDEKIEIDEPLKKDFCKSCRKCIDSCPSGALTDKGYDFKKCISYISQKKGELSEWESEILGNALYGCDICLRACVYNNKFAGEITDIDEMYPEAEKILSLTKSTFKKEYGDTAIFWRGLKTIKRNAENALKKGRIY